eukprot:900310_1
MTASNKNKVKVLNEEETKSPSTNDDDALLTIVKANCENVGNGIFKLTSLLNHQIDPIFMNLAVQKLYKTLIKTHKLSDKSITKIITAPVSGVIPSFAMSTILNIPTIYARHTVPITWDENY